jgi:hypothetical protein
MFSYLFNFWLFFGTADFVTAAEGIFRKFIPSCLPNFSNSLRILYAYTNEITPTLISYAKIKYIAK